MLASRYEALALFVIGLLAALYAFDFTDFYLPPYSDYVVFFLIALWMGYKCGKKLSLRYAETVICAAIPSLAIYLAPAAFFLYFLADHPVVQVAIGAVAISLLGAVPALIVAFVCKLIWGKKVKAKKKARKGKKR